MVFWTTQTPWHGDSAREDDAVATQAAGALLQFNAILNGLESASRVSHLHIHSASEACKKCAARPSATLGDLHPVENVSLKEREIF